MEERLFPSAHHRSEIEVMDMTFLNALDEETDAESIVRNDGSFDDGLGMVDFRASVAGAEVMSVSGESVGLRLGGDGRIDGEGEVEEETIGTDLDLTDLKGSLAGPVEALDGERLFSTDRPLSTSGESSGDQLAFGSELDIHDSSVEAFAEGIAGSLPHAVNLFRGGAHDEAESVVTKEELVLEGTKFPFGLVELKS